MTLSQRTVAELIAQGTEVQHRWRRKLRVGECVVLGRTAKPWSVPWDTLMSRQHVEMCWRDDALHVKKLEVGRNPVFFRGQEAQEFDVKPGQHFEVWGRNDQIFGPDGARAFAKDVPDAEIHLLDAGHFALETQAAAIADLIRDFLPKHVQNV